MKKARMALIVLLCLLISLLAVAEDVQEILSISFWGNSAITEATLGAVERFASDLKNVAPQARSYEDRADYMQWLAKALDAGRAGDVVELDMEMLQALGVDALGETRLMDLEGYDKQLDLGQFSYLGLVNGTANGQLSAVPISMSSHLMFWNMPALETLGLSAPPENSDTLIALATSLRAAGGGYLLAADAQGRIALLVTWLQSLYGRTWIDENTGAVSLSVEQVAQGMQYLSRLEAAEVFPKLSEQGDILEGWKAGKYLGVWAWDTEAATLQAALSEGSPIEMTARLSDWGPYDGGFQKNVRMLAIPKDAQNPLLAAQLIGFLLHSEKGVRILADVRGTPNSTEGYRISQRYRLLDTARSEVNKIALSWARYPMPKGFEAPMLAEKGGVYEQVLLGLSSGIMSEQAAAAALLSGIKVVIQ